MGVGLWVAAWGVCRALRLVGRGWEWAPEAIAVLGIVLASTAQLSSQDEEVREKKKKKKNASSEGETRSDFEATEPRSRPASARYAATCGADALAEVCPSLPRPVATEVGRLIDLVVRDYVSSWYANISDDPAFVCEVRADLAFVLGEVGTRCLDRLNLVAFALDTVADAATLQLRAHGEARASAELLEDADNEELATLIDIAESAGERAAAATIVAAKRRSAATLDRLRASGKLHPAFAWQRPSGDPEGGVDSASGVLGAGERRYLRHVAARLVRVVSPAESHACRIVRHLSRELVANVVLALAVGAFKPENVVVWIDKLLESRSSPASPSVAAVDEQQSAATVVVEPAKSPSAGLAPAGFRKADRPTPWPFFAGEMDAEGAVEALEGEGAYLFRVDALHDDRDPTEPLEFVLSYLVNDADVCNVVVFGDPAGPTFEYVRFGGGRRDPRLVDRATQLAEAPPSPSLEDLISTHFADVAFRPVVFAPDEDDDDHLQDRNGLAAAAKTAADDEEQRTRTPMPHELAEDDDARLFAEQRRHVLLIELQAAIEMAEDAAREIQEEVAALRHKHFNAAKPAASIERMVYSKEAADRQARKRERDLDDKVERLRLAAWRDGDGARRVHRIVAAVDAVLDHAGVAPATYCAYLLDANPQRLRLHPEALDAARADDEDDLAARRKRAAGIAWIVDALRTASVHSVLYDAAADGALTRKYFGPDAVLREPSDAARFLWFAERLDALELRPPVAVLRQHEPLLYCYCLEPDHLSLSTTTTTTTKLEPASSSSSFSGGGAGEGADPPDPPSVRRADDSEAKPKRASSDLAVEETPKKQQQQLSPVNNNGSVVRSRSMAPSDEDIVRKTRAAMARAAKLESQDKKGPMHTAAVRAHYLLRRRPTRAALLERGLLPRKRVGAVIASRVVAEDPERRAVAKQQQHHQRGATHSNKSQNLLESLQTAVLSSAATVGAAAVPHAKTTYYRVWILAPVAPPGLARVASMDAGPVETPSSLEAIATIVLPISRARAYARRRYRDFRALRLALAKAMSADRAAKLPALPPRRFAARFYPRGASALETRRLGLENFLTALLRDPALRDSHELRAFLFARRDEMRRILQTLDRSDEIDHDDRRISIDFGDAHISKTTPDDEEDDEEEDDDDDDEDDDDDDDDFSPSFAADGTSLVERPPSLVVAPPTPPPDEDVTADASSSPPPAATPSRPPSSESLDEPSVKAAAAAVAPADWRRLKRVEHRTYMLLRELFDVDHMGLMRRNFVALLRRGARALWSPAMATWLGERAAREARVKLVATLAWHLNELVWPGGQPRGTTATTQAQQTAVEDADRARLEDVVAAAALRDRLAGAIPASLASLVGQASTDDAVAKLHELVLCPIQLRSLAYTLLDLLLVEICPELELAVGGLDHLIS
ncbi:hypothetical protein CTAYLR_000432 [Chrysophaeum taylorii]|uniref:PX domain-containing protein n=1 Tax=Chrysophaeum taylorii TaxID=2483200 RepID=A0AAD7UGP1_9STRA|nr:hypothetical protein CTAYLR_000432 [Chrysophaeum taylorii]